MQTRKLVWLKLSVIGLVGCIAAIGFFGFFNNFNRARASAFGPTPGSTGAPGEASCTSCHTDNPVNSGMGGITISGIPANYRPNQVVPITVTTSQETGVIFGFQLTAIDGQGRQVGTFTLPQQNPPQMQLADGIVGGNTRRYVMHTVDGIVPTQFGFRTWNFTWTAPATRVGRVGFYAAGNAANSDGGPNGDFIYTTSRSAFAGTGISNFDGDAKSDIAVFRPSAGSWYISNSSNNSFTAVQFGASGDKIVPGDYDGDGKADLVVWRPTDGTWYLLRSQAGFTAIQFGANGDMPVSGDFDGDLKTDLTVFRPSNGSWYRINS
ncbi:MAG TPA: choice-of-anchor V domain-containing protein, partial [Pyrinomonadaceae bacterium]|nr:choice-of-anchor V domain-containing protein [Pyrinomonadaceae bacterium]